MGNLAIHAADFDYHLPSNLIAQTPAEPRDSSRLLVLSRELGTIAHRAFHEFPTILREGDVLVANDSRVLPARLHGRRSSSGGAVEIMLLRDEGQDRWRAFVKPGRRVRVGERITVGDDQLQATVIEAFEGGERLLELSAPGSVGAAIRAVGAVPLPPYIHRPLSDPDRYQTVYARAEGSVAAPTAGLHFTPMILDNLAARGIEVRYVTLHVGAGTFKPLQEEDVMAHTLHEEWAMLDEETAAHLRGARAAGRRIIAVGTTTTRVLETAARDGEIRRLSGWIDTFIVPGHQFQAVDGLVTNFHLPRSSLLLLVSALAGKKAIDEAYAVAIREQYRFYSFGDAMLIL